MKGKTHKTTPYLFLELIESTLSALEYVLTLISVGIFANFRKIVNFQMLKSPTAHTREMNYIACFEMSGIRFG